MSHADIVNAWFREQIATGSIARDTEAYNQAFAAKADLIARLDAAAPASVAAAEAAPPAPPAPGAAAEPPSPEASQSQPEPAAAAASEE